MSAEGFDRLVEHYENADDKLLATATVEDIALLLALRDSHPDGSPERDSLTFSGGCAKRWLSLVNSPEAPPCEEVRIQPVLRRLIDQIASSGVAKISGDGALVLRFAHEMLTRVTLPGRYDRLRGLLEPHADALRDRAKIGVTAALGALQDTVEIVSSKVLLSSPKKEINSFAGLAILSRGKVFQCRGDVKMLDSIPEDCTLVVEEGSCLINGHCLGHVAASVDVEVRGNHAGVAIVARGDIIVGACLNKCTAVSKNGNVLTRRCEDPKFVFAGQEITVLGDTRGGTFIAPTIEVHGIVSGGFFHVSRRLHAQRFSPLAGHGPVIELQRRVSCEQVDGLVDEDAMRMMTKLAAVRRGVRNVETLIQVAEQECEQYANSALIYLVGGEEKREKLEELSRAERRQGFLDRIIAGIEVLTETAEDQLSQGHSRQGADETWQSLDQELVAQMAENSDNKDLVAEREELVTLSRRLSGPAGAPSNVLAALREKRLAWLLERKELQQRIADISSSLRQSADGTDSFDRFLGGSTRVDVLSRVLQKARGRPIGDRLKERAQAPFLQIMLKTIDARRRRIKGYRGSLSLHKEEYSELSEQLVRRFHLNPPKIEVEEESPPTVSGHFDEGVRLCTEVCFLDNEEAPSASVLCLPDRPGEQTFRRVDDRIVLLDGES